MAFMLSRRKHGRKVLIKPNKRKCTTVNTHVNSSELNNLNISNSDNVIGTSKISHINIQNSNSFNTCITLQKSTDKKSSDRINDEIMDKKYE